MMIRFRSALALATLFAVLTLTAPARAANCAYPSAGGANGNQCYPVMMLVDPATGQPLVPMSSGGPVNVSQFGGSLVVTGTGASGAGIPRVTVSNDSFPSVQPVTGPGGTPLATAANQVRTAKYVDFAPATTLGASATLYGAIHTDAANNFTKFNVIATASVASSMNVIGCTDSACANGFIIQSATIGVNGVVNATVPTPYAYYRVTITNSGATAGTASAVTSFSAN